MIDGVSLTLTDHGSGQSIISMATSVQSQRWTMNGELFIISISPTPRPSPVAHQSSFITRRIDEHTLQTKHYFDSIDQSKHVYVASMLGSYATKW